MVKDLEIALFDFDMGVTLMIFWGYIPDPGFMSSCTFALSHVFKNSNDNRFIYSW